MKNTSGQFWAVTFWSVLVSLFVGGCSVLQDAPLKYILAHAVMWFVVAFFIFAVTS